MDTLHLTVRMTTAEAVETSVTTNNSLSQAYTNLDDHISQTSIDIPRFTTIYLIILLLCSSAASFLSEKNLSLKAKIYSILIPLFWSCKLVFQWIIQCKKRNCWRFLLYFPYAEVNRTHEFRTTIAKIEQGNLPNLNKCIFALILFVSVFVLSTLRSTNGCQLF